MKDSIFLTGATGFLGSEIVAGLIQQKEDKIYVLVRAKDKEEALHRLKANWYDLPELYKKIGTQVFPVVGDFTKEGLGLSDSDLAMLVNEVTVLFHVGAEVGFQKEEKDFRQTNVEGTRNVLELAKKIEDDHGLKHLIHVSTAYVAGQKQGKVLEEEALGTTYSSLYEKSKAEAEQLVRESGLNWSICRPGMIVGHSQTGRIKSFNTIYYVLKLMLTKNFKIFPVDQKQRVNLVPVDYVADSIVKIALSEERGKTYHLTCPTDKQPTSGELSQYVRSWAKEALGIQLPKAIYTPIPFLKNAGLQYNKKGENRKKNLATNLLTLLPYFYGGQDFDRMNTDSLLGEYDMDWKASMDALLDYACRKNFMQQTGRTVFEQAMVRRESKHFPVNYYDITSEGIRRISGERVNRRIEKIAAALWAWGIRRGDKVALTGINSVDYMTLDQAIGLLGGVSVPIYYTTPMEEADLLLQRSGARWFFVGDSRMMSHIDELTSEVTIVAFSTGLTIENEKAIPWKEFLKKGKKRAPKQFPDPGYLATIRYTSGTTGEPKGVMFSYGQLAWMGEVLTNLLGWEERNDRMRYLSFLPQSHVVEGILASYAPYYMLAAVDFYYLNDFGALVEALPKVRPTVFFSVPRFYEKLWDQLCANPFGKKYLSMEEGPAKQAMARLLKKVILKKAGLDACRQLIVGSAPVSEQLLLNFRALGIEIHNAYGQTEAPLITINRLGDNVIPTIGTPLPETEVTLAEDGELIVKGPQVALGYYGLETDTIVDGVLKTGDLGTLHDDGHITLHGRKKEMIITAYGKNINIPKIEERLKNIKGISEAVLIGENRPYCTALLWTEGEVEDLQGQIDLMNQDLSHPEQIRRYQIISQPLSIQAGELTPNLKVKRGNVEAHYQTEIEEMYQ